MKNFTILIPVYNDWESLEKLLNEIDYFIKDLKNCSFNCIVINDASTLPVQNLKKPTNISSIKIVNMLENRGHARCNAFGIRYLSKKKNFDYLILMDGDGEDRPEEIRLLVEKSLSDPSLSVVAKRIKRSEGPLFQLLYQIHKILTLIFTGKKINFGNYTCLTKKDAEILSSKASLWSSFSGSVKKYIKNYNEIDSIRGLRYFGPSKMSLYKLLIHSFSIIAVFKKNVFLRSAILLILLSYLSLEISMNIIFLQIFLVTFNLIIYLVSLRENGKELLESHKNEKDFLEITH